MILLELLYLEKAFSWLALGKCETYSILDLAAPRDVREAEAAAGSCYREQLHLNLYIRF